MSEQLSYKFVDKINIVKNNNETITRHSDYLVSLNSKTDGVIFTKVYYYDGIPTGTIDEQYHRIESNLATIYSREINNFIFTDNFYKTVITTEDLLKQNETVPLLLNNKYINVLMNYEEANLVNEYEASGTTYEEYIFINNQYNLYELPSFKKVWDQYFYNQDNLKDIKIRVTIDTKQELINTIVIDLTDLINEKEDQYKQYEIIYEFSDFSKIQKELPEEFNYTKTSYEELKTEFNNLWDTGKAKLDSATNLSIFQKVDYSLRDVYDSSYDFSYSLTMDIMDHIIRTTTSDIDYYTYLSYENGYYYSYAYEDNTYYKSISSANQSTSTDEFIVPVKDEFIIKEGLTTTKNKVYSYEISYQELINESSILDLLINQSIIRDDMHIDETMIDIGITFDTETETLKSISIDFKDSLQSLFLPNTATVDLAKFLIIFDNYNQVDFDTTVLDNSIIDDSPNEYFDDMTYRRIEPNGTKDGNFEYLSDIDIFEINIAEAGKYYFNVSYDGNMDIYIIDSNDEIVFNNNSDQYNFNFDAEIGKYYIICFNENDYQEEFTGPYQIYMNKATDDYSDKFENETYYAVGKFRHKTSIDGTINFSGDHDVFTFDADCNMYMELSGDPHIKLSVYNRDGDLLDEITSGEYISAHYYEYQNRIYYVISSATNETGNYSLSYSLDYNETYELNYDESTTGIIEHSMDSDVYEFEVTDERTKVIITIISDSFIESSLETQDDYLLGRPEGTPLIFVEDYSIGKHSFTISGGGHGQEYAVLLTKVVEDDYADTYTENYDSFGPLTGNNSLSGEINFIGDTDMFKLDITESGLYLVDFSNLNIKVTSCSTNGFCHDVHQIGDKLQYLITPEDIENERFFILESYTNLEPYTVSITPCTDEFPNQIQDSNIPIYNPDEEIQVIINNDDDWDTFMINITEESIYNLWFYATKYSYHTTKMDLEIYDENKQLIYSNLDDIFYTDSFSVTLNAGSYYIRVHQYTGRYNFFIEKAVDDYTDLTPLTMVDNKYEIKHTIDYVGDIDTFEINITEQGTYNMYFGSSWNDAAYFIFKDIEDNIILDVRLITNYSKSYKVDLSPGTYIIESKGDFSPETYHSIKITK